MTEGRAKRAAKATMSVVPYYSYKTMAKTFSPIQLFFHTGLNVPQRISLA